MSERSGRGGPSCDQEFLTVADVAERFRCHGLQALSELIHGDRELAGETTGARGICSLKRPIKVCSV